MQGGPLGDAQIADQLSLTQEAVKAGLGGLYEKLQLPHLTEAERRVVIVLCRPLCQDDSPTPATNRQVASTVFLAEDTVKARLSGLYDKFGLGQFPHNEKRARLAERILQSGLLSGSAPPVKVPPRRSSPRWSPPTIAVIVLAALLATAAGYVVFSGDSEPPQPPRAQLAADELAAQRFASRVAGVLRRLDTIRLREREQMAGAKGPRGQAEAGRAIASAYRAAAASIGRLTPAVDQRRAATVVIDKLTRAASAYDELARAARARDRPRYNDGRSAIGGREAAVRRAVTLVSAR